MPGGVGAGGEIPPATRFWRKAPGKVLDAVSTAIHGDAVAMNGQAHWKIGRRPSFPVKLLVRPLLIFLLRPNLRVFQ